MNHNNTLQVNSNFEDRIRNCIFFCLLIITPAYFLMRNSGASKTHIQPDMATDAAVDNLAVGLQGGDLQVKFIEPLVVGPAKREGGDFDIDSLSAKSVLVKDVVSGTALMWKNEYERRPIASITKLMSALVLLDLSIDWSTTTIACDDDIHDVFLQKGSNYSMEDVWNAALIASSNRAIMTLVNASGISQEKFVQMMNNKALALGMADTMFADPTGLSPDNLSTASDIAMLLKEALGRERIRESLLRKEYTLKSVESDHDRHLWNTNWLLLGWIHHDFTGLSGGKTGYIPASGYNFAVEIGNENENKIIVVVLGSNSHENRFIEVKKVGEWVFDNYEWSK